MNKHIVFDFDGVIIDSFQICYDAFRLTQGEISKHTFRSFFEENFFQAMKKRQKKENRQYKRSMAFKDSTDYARKKREVVKPVKNITNTIHKLAKTHTLYINTSSDSDNVHHRLKKNKIDHYFKKILGEDIAQSKVKKFERILDQGIKTKEILFITDTVGDIKEAKKCNIASIGVTRGFHSPETLLDAEPRYLATQPEEIIVCTDNFFQS